MKNLTDEQITKIGDELAFMIFEISMLASFYSWTGSFSALIFLFATMGFVNLKFAGLRRSLRK